MRGLRILLIVVVVLGILFVAADRVAVYFAENEAAKKIKSSQNLSETPDVSIKGFPFLTQVADSKLDEVHVGVDGVSASAGGRSIRVTKLDATLHDVKINSSFSSATADTATGSAHISYADLTKAADPGVKVSYGGRDKNGTSQVKVSAGVPVPVLGRTVERSVVSTVTMVHGDTIRLHADSVPGQEIPGLEGLIRKKIDFDRKIDGLPRGLKLDKITTNEDGVDITVTGSHVELAG
ncbi:LmeA family phospholipid-binding protein [Streptomyces varsoviensis]|uniref:DUF2993 domain-containing protein n=1 Tax=Streptomyces varsoviensis TaxID=67373 RepID=A0ABR5J2W5_9ACTN|nr:DUF2993 domain-containing protein [Streptomyces varsoviensis]KOG87781.1 hypothetical protein ADK38_23530 [Streptomyces varsoviensis]